jgi:hypothetical protein
MTECVECDREFTLDFDAEDDGLCHPCAHAVVETLREALEIAVRESDEKLRELADATGLPWQGKNHSEVVKLVVNMRDEWVRMRQALSVLSEWDQLNPPGAGSDLPWVRDVVDDGLGRPRRMR